MRTAEGPTKGQVVGIAAYLAFLAYQSLAGGEFGGCGEALRQHGPVPSWSDGLANFVAYLPLGMLAAALRTRPRAMTFVAAALAIAGFSLSMELLQACLAGRVSSWQDWAINSAGGLVGLATMSGLRLAATGLPGRASRRLGPAAAVAVQLRWPLLLFVGAWLASSLAPWRFTFDVGTIRANLAFLLRLPEWSGPDPWALARHLSGWLAIGVAMRACWPGRGAAALALCLAIGASLAGQLLLVRPALSFDELAGIAIAALLAVALPSASAGRVLARLVPVLALAAVGAYQLAPRRGAPLAAGFEWLPQLGLGGLLSAIELSLLFGWLALALVLSLRWLDACRVDIRWRRVALPLAAVGLTLASEFAQLRIPGRVPDTSAPIFTALGFVVAWALLGRAGLTGRAAPTLRRRAASPPGPSR